MVFALLGAALKDVVVEVGAGAAGDAQDVEDAGLLALMLVPMLYLLHVLRLRLLRSCASLVTKAEKTLDLCQIMLFFFLAIPNVIYLGSRPYTY